MAENKYGHLLDKYMDDKHVDYRTRQQNQAGTEQAAMDRYGNLLDYAKPDNKIYDAMLNVDRLCRETRQKREDEYERANIRRQERIEREKQEHEKRVARNNEFINDFLEKKEAERKAAEEKRRKIEREQNMLNDLQKAINSRDETMEMIARSNAMLARHEEKRKEHEEKMKWYREQEKYYKK